MNLFDELETQNKQIPLAEILRPKTLKEYFGQNISANGICLFCVSNSSNKFIIGAP